MTHIQIDSVSKYYNDKVAVIRCSLTIQAGERLVLLGPSGCGKTTLIRMIAGFIAPDEGRILFDDQLVAEPQRIIVPPEQRNVGMVFQDLALWPHLTVRGNIELGLKAHRMGSAARSERVREMLELVEMLEYVDVKPAQLSGGQQQRVALARALALHPAILLMDEPLSNLDIELNIKLRREVVKLQETLGFALLYITHDPDEAREVGSRIAIMRGGSIEQLCSSQTIGDYFKSLKGIDPK